MAHSRSISQPSATRQLPAGELNQREFLILSTAGGLRNADGSPIALGYHTGHWEVGLLMKAAAEELDLHFNSVKYRVGRAVARRGRPIAQDRLDVELALLVCHWYGPTVLRPDPS